MLSVFSAGRIAVSSARLPPPPAELFFEPAEQTVFNLALDKCQLDPRVTVRAANASSRACALDGGQPPHCRLRPWAGAAGVARDRVWGGRAEPHCPAPHPPQGIPGALLSLHPPLCQPRSPTRVADLSEGRYVRDSAQDGAGVTHLQVQFQLRGPNGAAAAD